MEEYYDENDDDYDDFNLGNNYIKNFNFGRNTQNFKTRNFRNSNHKKISNNDNLYYTDFNLNNQYLDYQVYNKKRIPTYQIALNTLKSVIELIENKRKYIKRMKIKLKEFLSNEKRKLNNKNLNKYKKPNDQKNCNINDYINNIEGKKNIYYTKYKLNKDIINPLLLENNNILENRNTINYDTKLKRSNFKKYMTKNLNNTNKDQYIDYYSTFNQNNNLYNKLISNNNSYDNSNIINFGDYSIIEKKYKKNIIKNNKQFNNNNKINDNKLPYNSPHRKNFIHRKKSPKDFYNNTNPNFGNLLNKKIDSYKTRNFDINFTETYKDNSIHLKKDKNLQPNLKKLGFYDLVPIKNISLMKNQTLEEVDINGFIDTFITKNIRESSLENRYSYTNKKLITKSSDKECYNKKIKNFFKKKFNGENRKKIIKNKILNNDMNINDSCDNLCPDKKNHDLLVLLNHPKTNENNNKIPSPKVYKKSNSMIKRKKIVGVKRDSCGSCSNNNYINNTVEDYNYYPEDELKKFSINNSVKKKVNGIHKYIIYKTKNNIIPENDLNTNQTYQASKILKQMAIEIKNNNNNNSSNNNNTNSEDETSSFNQKLIKRKDSSHLNSPILNPYFYSTVDNLNKGNKIYRKPSQVKSKSKLKKQSTNNSNIHQRNTFSLLETKTGKIKNTKLLNEIIYSPITNYTNYFGTISNMETENIKITSSLNTSSAKHKNILTKVKNKNCFIKKIRNYNKKINYVNKCYFSKIFIEKKNKKNNVIIKNKKNSVDMEINKNEKNEIITLFEKVNNINKRSFSYYFIINEKKLINKAKKNFEQYFIKKENINNINNINKPKKIKNKNNYINEIKSSNDNDIDNKEKGKNINIGINILNNILVIKNKKEKTKNNDNNNIANKSKIILGANKLNDIFSKKKSNNINSLYRNEIILLLNKLSVINYDAILDSLKNLIFIENKDISNNEKIYLFADIIINKGCNEKLYSNLYAKICKDLHDQTKNNKNFEDESIRSIIQQECSFRFNKNCNRVIFLGLINFIFKLVKVGIINIKKIFKFLEILYVKYLKEVKIFEFKFLYLESIVELVNKLGEIINENKNYNNLKNDLNKFASKLKIINGENNINMPSYLKYKIINLLNKHENNYKMSGFEKYIEDKINFVSNKDNDSNYNEKENEEYTTNKENKEKEEINRKQNNDNKNVDIEIHRINNNENKKENEEINKKENTEENQEKIIEDNENEQLSNNKNIIITSSKKIKNISIPKPINNLNKSNINSTNIDINNKIINKKRKSKKSKSKSRSKHNSINNQQQSLLLDIKENNTQYQPPTPSSYTISEENIISRIKNDLNSYMNYLNYLQIKNESKMSEEINNSYDWRVIDNLLKVYNIKLEDIILFYVKICKNLINTESQIFMANEYIKTIIEYYKNDFTQNLKYIFHLNMIKIYLDINNIIYENELMFEIMGKLLFILLVNKLFFMKDLNVFIGQTEDTICNITKVVKFTVICGGNLIKQYHNDFKFTKLFNSNAKIFEKYITQDLKKVYGLDI